MELYHIGTASSGRYPKGSGAYPRAIRGKGLSKNQKKFVLAKARKAKKESKSDQEDKFDISKLDEETLKREIKKATIAGDAKAIKKYSPAMTNQQLQEAINRIDLNAKIDKLANPPKPNTFDEILKKGEKLESALQKGANIMKHATNSYEAYKRFAGLKDGTIVPNGGGKDKNKNKNGSSNMNVNVKMK